MDAWKFQTADGARRGSIVTRSPAAISRSERADTAWSDPGSTFGIPDRWQVRQLRGLHLTVGNNNRHPGGRTFVVPESRTPWKVYGYAPNAQARGQMDLALIASGEASSGPAARAAAEAAACAWRQG